VSGTVTIKRFIRFLRRLKAEVMHAYHDEVVLEMLTSSCQNLRIEGPVKIIRPDRLTLGNNVLIHSNCVLYCSGSAPDYRTEGRIVIGNNVELGWGCVLHGGGAQIIIKDFAIIGAGAILISEMYSYEDLNVPAQQQRKIMGDIVIEENASVGANAVILPGVTVGRSSIVGAGAVVTDEIPSFSVAVGVPARVIKQREPR